MVWGENMVQSNGFLISDVCKVLSHIKILPIYVVGVFSL